MENNNNITTEKPSERIRFALQALVEFENYKNGFETKVDMGQWHDILPSNPNFRPKPVCIACLAGASTLVKFIPPKEWIKIDSKMAVASKYKIDYYELVEYERSINAFRIGDIARAFKYMGLDFNQGYKFDRTITKFEHSPDLFKQDLSTLANDLEKAGY